MPLTALVKRRPRGSLNRTLAQTPAALQQTNTKPLNTKPLNTKPLNTKPLNAKTLLAHQTDNEETTQADEETTQADEETTQADDKANDTAWRHKLRGEFCDNRLHPQLQGFKGVRGGNARSRAGKDAMLAARASRTSPHWSFSQG